MQRIIRNLGVLALSAALLAGGTLGCKTHSHTRTVNYQYTEDPSPRERHHHHPPRDEGKVIDETEWEMESQGTMIVDP